MLPRSTRDQIIALLTCAGAKRAPFLSEPDSKSLLRLLDIPVPPGEVVADPAQAMAAVERIGAPVAVKAVSTSLTHKSDVGGIVLPVESGVAAERACQTIAARIRERRPEIALDGFLIEAYRPAQPEWILALRVDPSFGPVIMFGLGGIFVELLRQVTFRLAPLRERDIDALLAEKSGARALAGSRGARATDRNELRRVIRALSELAACDEITGAISDVEINPLIITASGVLALDALVTLRHKEFR
jgi:succinyl-CoA synthetase beta subunit